MEQSQKYTIKGFHIKSFYAKSYQSMIAYDLLFLLGFATISSLRWLMVLLFLLVNSLYLIVKNYKVLDIYENAIVVFDNGNEIVITNEQFIDFVQKISKSGLPELEICYRDEFGNEKYARAQAPNINTVFSYLNNKFEDKNKVANQERERLEEIKKYNREHGFFAQIKHCFSLLYKK